MSEGKKRNDDDQSMDTDSLSQNGHEGNEESVQSEAQGQEQTPEGEGQEAGEASQEDEVTDRVAVLEARVAELEEENSQLKDQYLRKQADFENFRKRMRREKEEAVAYANQQLLLDIVSIVDDFERAIKSAEESRDFDSFHDGIVLIEKQFTGLLERKWGLRRFDSEGEEFDPQRHEAVATEESGDHDKSVVLEDYQKGYFLHDRVLRSAKVKVSVPSGENSGEQEGQPEGPDTESD